MLRLPVLVAGLPEVVSGEGHLSSPVRWVHVTELLDPASFLEGGELILTTGMPHPEDPTLLRAYVDQLADIGAAGLVIELGRRYQQVPADLVHACRSRDLPLIVLHREVRFIDVTQTVHALLLDAQGELLRRAQRVQDTFRALTLRRAEPGEIVEAAAELTGCPVILENLVHHAVHCAPAGRPIGQVLSAWPRRSYGTPTPDHTAPSGPEEWLVAPLEHGGSRWGRLVMLPDENDPVIGPEHVMVLEHAATALTLTRLSGRTRWDRAAHETALRDLIERRHRTATEARTRAESLGLPVTGHRLIALLIRAGSSAPREGFGDALAARLAGAGIRALVGGLRPGVVGVLIALARASAWQPTAERVGRFAREELGEDAVVAVGPGVTDLDQVARSFADAEQVLEAVRPGRSDRPFHVTSDIGLPELLYAIRADVRVQRYVDRRLGRLIEHDERHDGDLVATLRHYLAEAGNKSAAAKRSGLSRQAFYHRLRTIERLLGHDLESGPQRTELHVAIMALEAVTERSTADGDGRAAPAS
ncbi:PucR family transcriptional regulator ligand-binding domain-containing protein [Actinoallomurus vinaceus]|uniref:PucR family transcriptional regulator ligand-binding domain-containing protein n=1 Tax=Actinoallomurus vinaceus TaxID=1080074 RepID=A0ABP8U270_9ACTN